jgi:hypothetical protein
MVERRITVVAALLIGMYFGGKVLGDSPSVVPLMPGESILIPLCDGLVNPLGSSYGSFIRPAVYNVPGSDLPDPFEFYTISPELKGTVGSLVRMGVDSHLELDEIGRRRHGLGLLGLLDTNSDWFIDSSDFAVYPSQLAPDLGSISYRVIQ